MQAHLISMYHH